MATRYKITIEYDGTHFCGWQRQKDQPTIQGSIEAALFQISRAQLDIYGAGRTDAGVHARGQVAHFDLDTPKDPSRLRLALNHFLVPQKIAILDCEVVSPDFHARFSATERSYEYKCIQRAAPPALERYRALHIYKTCDILRMQEAATCLVGTHDFSAFRDSRCQAKSPIKSITEAQVEETNEGFSFYFRAPSFLHHQVRNMVGSLLEVGYGNWTPDEFQSVFKEGQRTLAGPTIAPCGLYFLKVRYG